MRLCSTRRIGVVVLTASFACAMMAACAEGDARRPASSAPGAKKTAPSGGDSEERPSTLTVPPAVAPPQDSQPILPEPPVPASPTTGTTPMPPPAAGSTEPSDSPRRREVALRAARAEVDQAQRELDLAVSDCQSACRALGSMERATGHLCDLASERDDRRRCEDAKTAVLRARAKIRATCGTCPGGPSLEKSAPIPSRP